MKRLVVVLIAIALPAPVWSQTERGLVGSWSFDEGQGREVHDASTGGHPGHVRGGARWVAGRQGAALEFNGVDALVEIAEPQGLNLEGDTTFMAWVRTTSDEGRDRLVFGDVAGLAVHRNITVELDRGALHVGHGNDSDYESFSSSLAFDGSWRHLAVVFEQPCYYLYVDGVLCETGRLSLPITPTNGAGRFIGGWSAGYFQGVIDEVRLYNRALAEREIRGALSPAVPLVDSPARVSLTPRFTKGVLGFHALFTSLAVPAGSRVECALTLQGDTRPRCHFSAALTPTRPDSERAVADAAIPMDQCGSGTYLLAATARDATGKPLLSIEKEFDILPPPDWFGKKIGVTDAVLPPYTPVEVSNDDDSAVLGVWGRTYRLGELTLPRQIVSRDAPLLAGPVSLRAVVDGKQVSWSGLAHCDSPANARPSDSRTDCVGRPARSAHRYEHRIRRVSAHRLCATASAPVEVESLVLEIPVKREHARYLYTWPTTWGVGGVSGELIQAMAFRFHPIVWLGDEVRGLAWMCESENNFSPDDPNKVIEVIPGAEEVKLRIRIIGQPTALSPERPLEYVFALQATPLKPWGQDGWESRFGSCPWYGDDYDLLNGREFLGKPALDRLQELGVRTLIAWNWTPRWRIPGRWSGRRTSSRWSVPVTPGAFVLSRTLAIRFPKRLLSTPKCGMKLSCFPYRLTPTNIPKRSRSWSVRSV